MNCIRVGGEKFPWVDEKTDLSFWSTISYRLELDGSELKTLGKVKPGLSTRPSARN